MSEEKTNQLVPWVNDEYLYLMLLTSVEKQCGPAEEGRLVTSQETQVRKSF